MRCCKVLDHLLMLFFCRLGRNVWHFAKMFTRSTNRVLITEKDEQAEYDDKREDNIDEKEQVKKE